LQCNPGAAAVGGFTVEILLRDGVDASHLLEDLCLDSMVIAVLPESIGDRPVDGDLDFNRNELESLPESFGSSPSVASRN